MPTSENVARFLAAVNALGVPRFDMSDLEKVYLNINFMYTDFFAMCLAM